jgi:hypothetical protein
MPDALTNAERRLFDTYRIALETRHLRLATRMSSQLSARRAPGIRSASCTAGACRPRPGLRCWPTCPTATRSALDLPGFGLSDAHSYTGRPLREHAVAQLSSTVDALGLERATIV